jgi:hypothetical protein
MSDWLALDKSIDLTLRPIDTWPGKLRGDRERSPFSAPLKDTLAMLRKALTDLQARKVVLEIALREQDFRQDGLPRASVSAQHPGVILSFESCHGPLRFAFDHFTRWDANLRAVAMHLDHLRMAGLYGVGNDGEQYRGWVALPPGDTPSEPIAPSGRMPGSDFNMQELEAARFLAAQSDTESGRILRDRDYREQAIRAAQSRSHPDRWHDAQEKDRATAVFVKVQNAAEVLRGRLGR